jgi:transposase-like protein
MNIVEISNKFPTELHCIEYAEKLRWGKKPKCAYCGSDNLLARNKDMRHRCRDCNKSTAVTINTELHNTRLPLKTWFFAVSIITDAKKGLSALQLQRNLNISYPSAFNIYHKIRGLMAKENKNIQELEGVVEMDETYIGGKPRKMNDPCFKPKKRAELDKQINELKKEGFDFTPKGRSKAKCQPEPKRGRGTDNIPVVGIIERGGDVVAQVMKTISYDNLKDMVKKYVVEDKSVLVTDSLPAYNSMKKIIEHIKTDHSRLYSYRGVNSNTIESFWAIIERGIMGQYHSVSPKMLPNYVAEFVYKYNNRNNNDKMFSEMLKKLVNPITL